MFEVKTNETISQRELSSIKTKQKIIRAAKKLFVSLGFNGTSMREIAQESAVTQSLIHHHFGSKESLWIYIRQDYLTHFSKALAEIRVSLQQSAEKDNLLHELFKQCFNYFNQSPEDGRMMLWLQLTKEPKETNGYYESITKELDSMVTMLQQQNLIRQDISSKTLLSIILSLASNKFDNNQDVEEYAQSVAKFFRAKLQA